MEEFLKSAGYGAIFALSFISAMGLPVGAELALIYGGVLASGQVPGDGKPLNLAIVIIVATLGEVLGSVAGYSIGRFGGRTLVDRVGKYVLLTHKDLDRAEAWFARRGEPVVLVGRFIPLLRSFVSFAAGLGEMAVAKFTDLHRDRLRVWCTALCSLGYSLGEQLQPRPQGVQLGRLRPRRAGGDRRGRRLLAPSAGVPEPARGGTGRDGGLRPPGSRVGPKVTIAIGLFTFELESQFRRLRNRAQRSTRESISARPGRKSLKSHLVGVTFPRGVPVEGSNGDVRRGGDRF